MEKEQALDRMAETVKLSKLEDAEKAELLELLARSKANSTLFRKTTGRRGSSPAWRKCPPAKP
jgi:hypothetical protein